MKATLLPTPGYPQTVSVFFEGPLLTKGFFAYVEFRNAKESDNAVRALNSISISGYALRVSKAKPFAKMLADSEYNINDSDALKLSAKSGITFQDIDLEKSMAVLNKPFKVTPPSTILVLKNVVTVEEVH